MARGNRKNPNLSAEDAALWQAVTRDITPLASKTPVQSAAPKRVKSPEIKKTGETKPPALTAPPPSAPRPVPDSPKTVRSSTLDRRTHKKLARGHLSIDSRIDLHGMRQEEAHRRLCGFLREAQARGDRVVLVITGKGKDRGGDRAWWEARETGILKRIVPRWLHESDLRSIVVGFDWASQSHGGEGALYVRLRKRR